MTTTTLLKERPQAAALPIDDVSVAEDALGSVNPASGLTCSIKRFGATARLDFTLTAVSITVTDAGGSGSSRLARHFQFRAGLGCPARMPTGLHGLCRRRGTDGRGG
jgi:hypothetical protein